MAETWSKKERERKKQQNKKEKEERKLERKNNARDGNDLDSMLAYVDENGNLSSSPPVPSKKSKAKNTGQNETDEGASTDDRVKKGIVTFFDQSKGYGFIQEDATRKSYFVHVNSVGQSIGKEDRVTFEVEMTPKGASAVKVKVVH
jgi:cold shock CspA family protein